MFDDRHIAAEEVVLRLIKEARSWEDAQDPRGKSRPAPSVPRPLVLPSQAVHCFTDASWLAATRDCGAGWCFKEANLKIISQSSIAKKNVASPLIAEAIALKAALIAAKTAGF